MDSNIKAIYFNTTAPAVPGGTVKFHVNVQYTDNTPVVNEVGIADSQSAALQQALRIAMRCPKICPVYKQCQLEKWSDACTIQYNDMYHANPEFQAAHNDRG